MTAKEPRPASHFRLSLGGIEGASMIQTGQLIFPVIGASPEVMGFRQAPDGPEPAEQELVDRVAQKLQGFYDGLPADERPVLDAIMAQAAAYAWAETS